MTGVGVFSGLEEAISRHRVKICEIEFNEVGYMHTK